MTDYISRDDTISVLSILADKMSDSGNTAMQQGISAIASLPAADVVDREAYNQMVDLALRQGTIVNKIKELVGARE